LKKATKTTKTARILHNLRAAYPDAHVELHWNTPFQLLAATILSAQCTDKRVNLVTPALFAKYPTVESFADADIHDLETLIKSTGFYRNKAKFIKHSAQKILADYGGHVPHTMHDLLTLPGVARKTANCILGTVYKTSEGIIVDTHVLRVSKRLGLTNANSPAAVERSLMACVPKNNWYEFATLMVWHGRYTCIARKPNCPQCPLQTLCPSAEKFYPDATFSRKEI